MVCLPCGSRATQGCRRFRIACRRETTVPCPRPFPMTSGGPVPVCTRRRGGERGWAGTCTERENLEGGGRRRVRGGGQGSKPGSLRPVCVPLLRLRGESAARVQQISGPSTNQRPCFSIDSDRCDPSLAARVHDRWPWTRVCLDPSTSGLVQIDTGTNTVQASTAWDGDTKGPREQDGAW